MPQEIVDYWFSEPVAKLWFKSTPQFDQQLRDSYEDLWQRARDGELEHWRDSAIGCLALVILLDQFPLNMFRGEARCYSTEAASIEVARHALARGFDRELEDKQRAFLYMPFMHSEALEDQELALQLFDQPGLEDNLRFARHHHGIVQRFGRFPHRNEALGRVNTPAENEYLQSKEAFTG